MSAPRISIVAGGVPGPEERTAITAAVLRVLRAREGGRAPTSAWARAGRLEAAGRITIASRAALPPR